MKRARKFSRLLSKAIYRRGLIHGVAAAVEHEPFLRNHHFGTVLDAGANKGQFALATRALIPEAKIIAFEPLEAPARTFEAVFGGDQQVSLCRLALGDMQGTATVNVSERVDSSSLLPIGRAQTEAFPGTSVARTEAVSVTTLDAVLGNLGPLAGPVLLKIDVQGFELCLLRGAVAALSQIDDIYVELSYRELYEGQALADEAIAWLRDHGFALNAVFVTASDRKGLPVQSDVHFCRRG